MAKTTTTLYGTSGGPRLGAAPKGGSLRKTTSGGSYQDALQKLISGGEEAKAATESRYGEATSIYDQIAELFSPGGQFGAGMEAQLGRAKEQSIASGSQALVSSGLYGTTQAAGLGKQFEEEIGVSSRLKLEDMKTSRYAEALGAKAGLLERREDVGPDQQLIAELMKQIYGA